MALHNLAYELHMTVHSLRSSMTVREFADWLSWYRMRDEQRHRAEVHQPGTSGAGMTLDLTSEQGVAQLATMFKPPNQ